MKIYYDLHIHSALSPCGGEDMTPNNIVNMALLKGLDLISLTDHNHILNLRPTEALAREKGLFFLPGIEIHTLEDVHVLCYFEELETIEDFFKTLEPLIPQQPHQGGKFGHQRILGRRDDHLGDFPLSLLLPLAIDLKHLGKLVAAHDGLFVPAHIHRQSYGILSQLGFLPEDLTCHALENPAGDTPQGIPILTSSDAHFLGNISERDHFIEVEERSLRGIFKALKEGTS
jgi:hypothetical protein